MKQTINQKTHKKRHQAKTVSQMTYKLPETDHIYEIQLVSKEKNYSATHLKKLA